MPEFFSFVETVFPTGKDNSLIGTSQWEMKFSTGLIKGFEWGTITPRVGIEYAAGDGSFGFSYSFDYLKKLSDPLRLVAVLEGFEDEVSLMTEIQWHVGRSLVLKANTAFGVTSKAVDFAPEIGMMFRFMP
jgi:hypothetical protein